MGVGRRTGIDPECTVEEAVFSLGEVFPVDVVEVELNGGVSREKYQIILICLKT